MSDRLTLAPETIAGEVDRYAGMPGQALGYQIGNLALRGLRQRAESTLGTRFTHRGFHDAVTGAGAVASPAMENASGAATWLQFTRMIWVASSAWLRLA